jgi:hypothetical protein
MSDHPDGSTAGAKTGTDDVLVDGGVAALLRSAGG